MHQTHQQSSLDQVFNRGNRIIFMAAILLNWLHLNYYISYSLFYEPSSHVHKLDKIKEEDEIVK